METNDTHTLQEALSLNSLLTVRDLLVGHPLATANRFHNEKFIFSPNVKRIKVDIGLSNDGVHGCKWLLEDEDVGVIGIEANPSCQKNLLLAGSRNSYFPCLCLEFDTICRFAGFVSEIYVKQASARAIEESGKKPIDSLHDMCLPYDIRYQHPITTTFYRIVPQYVSVDAEHVFRALPVVEELKDIKGKYILLGAAIDNIESEQEIIYQNFYSTPKDLGTSSLRKEVIEDYPAKGEFEEIKVLSLSLDSVLKHVDWDKFPYIECIKIDVEGKELDVLRSCEKYMEKVVYFRVEAFECTDTDNPPATDPKDLLPFMEERGFELFDDEPGDYKFVNTRYKKLIEQYRSKDPLSW